MRRSLSFVRKFQRTAVRTAALIQGRRRLRVLVVGAAGYFGRLLVEELAETADVVAGGRRPELLESLGSGTVCVVDLADANAVARALETVSCAVYAAGPFQSLPMTLLDACCERGIPYVDISDDREFCARVCDRVATMREKHTSDSHGGA